MGALGWEVCWWRLGALGQPPQSLGGTADLYAYLAEGKQEGKKIKTYAHYIFSPSSTSDNV